MSIARVDVFSGAFGLVFGTGNSVTGDGGAVLGGSGNAVTAPFGVVLSGVNNTVSAATTSS